MKTRNYILDDLIKIVKNANGKIVSGTYKNALSKFIIECDKKHQWETCLDRLNKGSWCQQCDPQIKRKVDKVHEIVKAYNGKVSLTIEEYKNNDTTFDVTCENGHTWKTKTRYLLENRWCAACNGKGRIKYEDVLEVAKKRNGKCLTKEDDFQNGNQNLEWECHVGHSFKKSMEKIRGRNQWCPRCSTKYKSENICRFYMEEIFGEKFPQYRAKWLISPIGARMELDGFCEKLNIAFEYNGLQHYESVTLFNKERSLEDIQKYDEYKMNLCKERNIKVIIIPTFNNKIKLKDLKSEIYKQTKYLNIIPKIKEEDLNIDLNKMSVSTHSEQQLQTAHKIAESKGWKCVSDKYINCLVPLKWECENGHIFERKIGKITRINSKCPKCPNEKGRHTKGKKVIIAKEKLKEMLDNGYMIKDIAKHFNVSTHTISRNIKDFNLKKKNRFFIERDELYSLYVEQDWTAQEIADHYDVDIKVIYNHRDHYKMTKIIKNKTVLIIKNEEKAFT